MTDLMQRLAAARPTDDDLVAAWPATDRERALARIRARSARPRVRRRTPWLAAAAVAGLCAFPIATSLDDSSAQALTELAAVAAESSGPVLAPGTFLHVKTESLQENSSIFDDGKTLDTNRESWVSWDGDLLAIDTRPSAGWTEYHEFPAEDLEPRAFSGPTPEFAASLPDTAPELAAYLDANVSGSNSHEEAIYTAITDLAHSNFLPPETLSAALLVLADVDGVSVNDVEVDGRPAVEISYAAWWARLIVDDTVTIDEETARVINVRESDPTGSYRSDTVLTEVVDEVPGDVLSKFAEHDDGERVYD